MRVLCLSASVFQEGALTKEEDDATESESEPTESQTTPGPKKALVSFQVPEGILGMKKMNPTLLLKPVFKAAVGYICDLCSQSFTSSSQLVKHKQLHEGKSENLPTNETECQEPKQNQDPSFPCNMCDQSFTTTRMLKRHKLLHVRDGRKCPWCGVLFCKRHNHVLFLPQSQSEQECSVDESEPEEPEEPKEPKELQESDQPEEPDIPQEPKVPVEPEEPQEPGEPETNDEAQSVLTLIPSFPMQVAPPTPTAPVHVIINPVPTPSQGGFFLKIPLPRLSKLSRHSLNPQNANDGQPLRRVHAPPPEDLKLPNYLQVFSPQRLTSVFFQVQRNYNYILEKAKDHKDELGIIKSKKKKLPCEESVIPQGPHPAVPQLAKSGGRIQKERIAYDMEIVL